MKSLLALTTLCAALAYAAIAPAAGDDKAGKAKSVTCAACHNADGNSMIPVNPKLAGQHATYLVKQLLNFKNGERDNPIMSPMAKTLSDQDMEDLAAYFENQPPSQGFADPQLLKQGEALYRGGNSATGLPACMACHGPDGSGNPGALFPVLSGQHAEYTDAQLKAFRVQQRANDYNQMMRMIAAKMSDAEIKAVSSYIQGLCVPGNQC